MEIMINKNIKRHREPKFTVKRSPYKKYQTATWIWTNIFDEIVYVKNVLINVNIKIFVVIVKLKMVTYVG